jgi:uncharacterized protein (DUF2147 family)
MTPRTATSLLFLAFMATFAGTPGHAAEPIGTWLSQSGETKVKIAPCGTALCGTVIWVKGGGTDKMNPDPAKAGRPLVGIQMIHDAVKSGSGYRGSLYNYKDGGTYAGKLQMLGDSQLKLSGCRMRVFCRSQTWMKSE